MPTKARLQQIPLAGLTLPLGLHLSYTFSRMLPARLTFYITSDMLLFRLRNHGSKTRTERKGLPAFSCLVEVLSHTTWRVHPNVAASVDALLANKHPVTQLRQHKHGKLMIRFETAAAASVSALSEHGEPWLAGLFQLAKSMRVPTDAS